MLTLKNGISAILLSSVLFACGSGGGGGDGSSSGGGFIDPATCVLPSNVVAITAANAQSIASEVIGAIQAVLAFADADSAFIEFNDQMIVPNPATVMCDMGGNATITLTDNDMSTDVSMGDLISANFSSCMDTGTTLNGLYSATYTSITEVNAGEAGTAASANDWDFIINGNANNLRVNDSNLNAAADGDSTAAVDFTVAGAVLASTATSAALTVADSNGQCASVQNASIVSSAPNVTTNPSTYSAQLNQMGDMIVASTTFSGVVAVPAQAALAAFGGMEDFIDPMIGDYGQLFAALDNPDSGVLVINGFNGSSITLTVSMGAMYKLMSMRMV